MQFSTILAGALAGALTAVAAPTTGPATVETKRGAFNATGLNNLAFNSLDLNYLNVLNAIDLGLLQQLAVSNNLNALAFASVFSSGVLNLQSVLRLQQLQTMLQLGRLGVFNQFDLATLDLQLLQLGLIQNVGAFDLGTLIDAALVPQITTIVQQGGTYLF